MEKKNIITVQMEEDFYNKVMTNVPPSGGSGGSEGNVNIRCLNILPIMSLGSDTVKMVLKVFPGLLAVKIITEDGPAIAPLAYYMNVNFENITYIAVLDNFLGLNDGTNVTNSSEAIESFLSYGCTEITKEEFYAL